MRPSSTIASKEVEYDPVIQESAWEFILTEWKALRTLCKHMSRGDAVLAEDMMSDVVMVYTPKAINCWDPNKSSMRGHIMRSLRMYLWKYSNYRHAPGDAILPEEHSNKEKKEPWLDIQEEAGYILSRLSPYDRALLQMYHAQNLTHADMAGVLECSKGTARLHYQRALENARAVAERRDDGLCGVRDEESA